MAGIMYKCKCCGRLFEPNFMNRRYCGDRVCQLIRRRRYQKEYKAEHKVQKKEYDAKYYQDNRQDIIYKSTLYRLNNRESTAERSRLYMAARKIKMMFMRDYLLILPQELLELK